MGVAITMIAILVIGLVWFWLELDDLRPSVH
jgi:hypothetical protein